eukprot:1544796-Alexandrium_andersonii.AAC.1
MLRRLDSFEQLKITPLTRHAASCAYVDAYAGACAYPYADAYAGRYMDAYAVPRRNDPQQGV